MLKSALVLALAAGAALAADPPKPACTLIPGWSPAGPARSYTAENLWEYLDGNAEGYVQYNLQRLQGVTCKKDSVTFAIDVSDMGDADFAYGFFSATRDLRLPEYRVGMGGQLLPRRLIFAKGQYYVEIAAEPDGDHTAALKLFAAALEKLLPGEAAPPAALGWFPKENLESLRLVPESVLGLRLLRRGYVAQYPFGKAFVVMDDNIAEVFRNLKARFANAAPAPVGEEAFVGTDKYLGRVCVFRQGRYLGGYAVTAEGTDPLPLAVALAARIH